MASPDAVHSPSRPVRAGLLTAVACAGMFVFGIVMALLGAVLPSLSGRLQFQVDQIGTLFLFMNFAMLATSAFIGAAIDAYGMKPPLVAGPVAVAGALILIVRAAAFDALIPAVLLLGIGGGALNAATNTLVADLHDDEQRKGAALNLLGVFFGFGALLLPFAIGALLATFGIAALLAAAALLCAAAGLFALAPRFPAPKQRRRLPVAQMPRFLRSPLVLALGALLFFQSGVEFTTGGYISTYLTRSFGMTVAGASWVLAGYWAGLMLARIWMSRALLSADPFRVVLACAVLACAASAVAAAAPGPALASAGIIAVGIALSAIYPTVLGIAGARFQEHSGTVFGLLFTMALLGGMLLPWISGFAGGALGIRWVFAIVAGAFAAVALLSRVVVRSAYNHE